MKEFEVTEHGPFPMMTPKISFYLAEFESDPSAPEDSHLCVSPLKRSFTFICFMFECPLSEGL